MVSAHYLKKGLYYAEINLFIYLSQRFHILHGNRYWWGHDPFDFEFTKSKGKVTSVTFDTCRLVLARTRISDVLSSLGQRSRLHRPLL